MKKQMNMPNQKMRTYGTPDEAMMNSGFMPMSVTKRGASMKKRKKSRK